jgi:hypothetical protein
MTFSPSLILLLLGILNLGTISPFVNAQTPKSLSVVFVPQGNITGCCSQDFYNATKEALLSYVIFTTGEALLGFGLTLDDLDISTFVLINSNSCIRRQRSLRARRNEEHGQDVVPRETKVVATNKYSSSCSVSLN